MTVIPCFYAHVMGFVPPMQKCHINGHNYEGKEKDDANVKAAPRPRFFLFLGSTRHTQNVDGNIISSV